MLRFLRVGAVGLAMMLGSSGVATADEPAPAAASSFNTLMNGLAHHAQNVEEMTKRGAFTLSGRMETLDDAGKPTEVKEMTMRSTPTGAGRDRITKVMKYTEDGKDKTAEAQAKADERRAKRKEGKKDKSSKELKLPFLASEQSRYTFSVAERDKSDPTHLRIQFQPKTPAEDALKGSAWVDEKSNEVLSIGFSLSKNPMFIDHIEVQIVFGLATALGRAPSSISLDARGGFLFIHRHYRGNATITDPALAY